jgi:hypothetical protein
MPDTATAAIIQASKIGVELTDAQCAVLASLVQLSEHQDGP